MDAGNQVTSQTVDPNGTLDRLTSYTYDPDDNVTSQSFAQGSNSAIQTTSYTYDAMGDKKTETLTDPGAEGPVGWWAADSGLRDNGQRLLRHGKPGDGQRRHLDQRRRAAAVGAVGADHDSGPRRGHHGVVLGVGVGGPARTPLVATRWSPRRTPGRWRGST